MTKKVTCKKCNGWGYPRIPCNKAGKKAIHCISCHTLPPIPNVVRCNNKGLLILRCPECGGDGWYKLKEAKFRLGRKRWRR